MAGQMRGQRSANRRPVTDPTPEATCRTCGAPLTGRSRQLCQACWPVTRAKLAADRATAGNATLAAMRARGEDPTNTPDAAAKRSASLSRRKAEELRWRPGRAGGEWTVERYETELLPALTQLPLSALQQATGLSVSACSRIRSGKLTPHRRHWEELAVALASRQA